MTNVRVMSSQLAKIVHNNPSNGHVNKSTSKYDRLFKHGGKLEKSPTGFRLLTLDETHWFNLTQYEKEQCTRMSFT